MKISSSVKVGTLALVALTILLFTILWVKGRAFSSAERIEVKFKDVNGMRPGSGVQMMGLRIGQVEEIVPVIEDESSYVRLKFVITEKGINIPKASTISIQQSGLIGEQFLEITPPKLRTVYLPVYSKNLMYTGSPVEIKLDDKYYDVGVIKKTQIMTKALVPLNLKETINTDYAYKIDYVVNLPGLILPPFMTGEIVKTNGVSKMRIAPLDNTPIPYPYQTSPYTIIQPMRIADFLDWQYKAAESLTETNKKINDLLNDEIIADIKDSIINVKTLTAQATTTLEKAELLIDESRSDIKNMITMMDDISKDFRRLTKNVNEIIEDKDFKPTVMKTADALANLSNELAPIIGSIDAKKFGEDVNAILTNVNEISSAVNTMTKDEKLKTTIISSVNNLNKLICDASATLNAIDNTENKEQIKLIMKDITKSAENLKKFTNKLNKRFLLFRLLF